MKELLRELNAESIESKHFLVGSTDEKNPWILDIEEKPFHNDQEWEWKVDGQIFSEDHYAASYLKRRIRENRTGIRIIYNDDPQFPLICGDGSDCRYELRGCFSMLCSSCPKADKIEADKDGLVIEYRSECEKSY